MNFSCSIFPIKSFHQQNSISNKRCSYLHRRWNLFGWIVRGFGVDQTCLIELLIESCFELTASLISWAAGYCAQIARVRPLIYKCISRFSSLRDFFFCFCLDAVPFSSAKPRCDTWKMLLMNSKPIRPLLQLVPPLIMALEKTLLVLRNRSRMLDRPRGTQNPTKYTSEISRDARQLHVRMRRNTQKLFPLLFSPRYPLSYNVLYVWTRV